MNLKNILVTGALALIAVAMWKRCPKVSLDEAKAAMTRERVRKLSEGSHYVPSPLERPIPDPQPPSWKLNVTC
jgi:hypothetical protein